ncbi:MAG: ribonuclease HII [Burkholderiales bacterium]|nr:ribonuclease HII [Burkholderiales bacterium]
MKYLCGTDEAGRGPLAGAVYAAAVVLNRRRPIAGLDDSKKLTPQRREELAELIRERAVVWAVAVATVQEIDSINILRASLLAMQRAVEALAMAPCELLVDGIYCPQVKMPARAIIGGDACIPQISAASILAKVARDAEMCRLASHYPNYGFEHNKGYPTPEHLEALQRFGATEIHRRSFAPVAAVLEFELRG